MAKPKAWSFSALDTFKNCPRQYHEKYVTKSVVEERSPQMIWGEQVHKHFEDRQATSVPLPYDLKDHETFMLKLATAPGHSFTEQKIALDKKLQPCNFFDRDTFYRGIADWSNVFGPLGWTIDYKTGKPHKKMTQLAMVSIHMFAMYPALEEIKAEFYWTKTLDTTGTTYTRAQIPEMWNLVLPDLKQYKEAYNKDVWQPRPSGLCNGWCPIKDCEHWKPKR